MADVLDAIQELRGAGAETMQIDGVRVGVSHRGHRQPRRPDGRRPADHRPVRVRRHRLAAEHGDGDEHPRRRGDSGRPAGAGSVDDRPVRAGASWTRCDRSTTPQYASPDDRRTDATVLARRAPAPPRSRRRSPHGHARRPPLHRPARVGAGAGHRAATATVVRVGITDHAQDALGDIVFVQLPEVGDEVGAGDPDRRGGVDQVGVRRLRAGRRCRGGRQRRRWPTRRRRSTPTPTAPAGWSRSPSPATAGDPIGRAARRRRLPGAGRRVLTGPADRAAGRGEITMIAAGHPASPARRTPRHPRFRDPGRPVDPRVRPAGSMTHGPPRPAAADPRRTVRSVVRRPPAARSEARGGPLAPEETQRALHSMWPREPRGQSLLRAVRLGPRPGAGRRVDQRDPQGRR